MQVKIEIHSSFTASADLSGAELEVLNRAFGKMKRIDEKWLEGENVLVESASKLPRIDITATPGLLVMSDTAYRTAKEAQERAEAAKAAHEAQERATFVAILIGCNDDQEAFQGLIDCCYNQSLLYYKEKDSIVMRDVTDTEVIFDTVSGDNWYTVSIDHAGKFNRVKAM